MPEAKNVNPQKWESSIVLYDDGHYSACWGYFNDDRSKRVLGVRWNDNYPTQGGNPLWYVEPEFTTFAVLQALLTKLLEENHEHLEQVPTYITNISKALSEFSCERHG